MSGEVKSLEVSPSIGIPALKEEISRLFGVAPERQRLIFQAKLLKDEHKLDDYVKDDDMTIHMMARAQESSQQAQAPPQAPTNQQAGFALGGLPQGLNQMIGNIMNSVFQNMPQQVPPQQVPPQQASPQQASPQGAQQVPQQAPQSGPREFSLPFNHVQNIGNIVNHMHGPGAGFPPPRMPQLNVDRNSLVILGGFMYQYYFQLMRLLPFMSRVSDLLQRESLITDSNERNMLQVMARNVGRAFSEIIQATQPVAEILQNLEVGQSPGNFNMRLQGNHVVSENQVPRQQVFAQQIPQGLFQQVPQQGAQAQGVQSMLSSVFPMMGQMLGGSPNTTLRDLMRNLQLNDESEENLPMMDLFINITFQELISVASGNWEPFNRLRDEVRTGLVTRMGMDSPENRNVLVQEVVDYIISHYNLPEQYQSRLREGYNYHMELANIVRYWYRQALDLVMDYSGDNFHNELKKLIQLMVGNFMESMRGGIEGGIPTAIEAVNQIMNQALSQQVPSDLVNMLTGVSMPMINTLLMNCHRAYQNHQETHQTQSSPAAQILINWQATISQDQERQFAMGSQRPLSDSYVSSDVFRQERERPNAQDLFFGSLGEAFRSAGVQPVNQVIPSEVTIAFTRGLREQVRQRLDQDPDFRSGHFEHLDRLNN